MHFVCNCIKFKESELNRFQNLRNGEKVHFKISFSHNGVRPYQVCTVVTSILSLSVLIFKILTVNDLMLLHMLKKLRSTTSDLSFIQCNCKLSTERLYPSCVHEISAILFWKHNYVADVV